MIFLKEELLIHIIKQEHPSLFAAFFSLFTDFVFWGIVPWGFKAVFDWFAFRLISITCYFEEFSFFISVFFYSGSSFYFSSLFYSSFSYFSSGFSTINFYSSSSCYSFAWLYLSYTSLIISSFLYEFYFFYLSYFSSFSFSFSFF